MYKTISSVGAIAALAATVTAHGTVTGVSINDQFITGFKLDFYYAKKNNGQIPQHIGWYAENTDNGFVGPSDYGNPDIICHKSASPDLSSDTLAKVEAGGTVTFDWTQWAQSHVGPLLTYVASYTGDISAVKKETLEWVKIDEAGYESDQWAAIKMTNQNNSWPVTVPKNLAPGKYVFRHEAIALHSAGQANGAQNYPQCLNIEVTGSGTEKPKGVVGTKLYTATDPGILFNVYTPNIDYKIPGPPLFGSGSSGSSSGSSGSGSPKPGPSNSTPSSTAGPFSHEKPVVTPAPASKIGGTSTNSGKSPKHNAGTPSNGGAKGNIGTPVNDNGAPPSGNVDTPKNGGTPTSGGNDGDSSYGNGGNPFGPKGGKPPVSGGASPNGFPGFPGGSPPSGFPGFPDGGFPGFPDGGFPSGAPFPGGFPGGAPPNGAPFPDGFPGGFPGDKPCPSDAPSNGGKAPSNGAPTNNKPAPGTGSAPGKGPSPSKNTPSNGTPASGSSSGSNNPFQGGFSFPDGKPANDGKPNANTPTNGKGHAASPSPTPTAAAAGKAGASSNTGGSSYSGTGGSAASSSGAPPSGDSGLPKVFTVDQFIKWLEKVAGQTDSTDGKKARRHARAFSRL
ncbi:hypothetical protein HRS9139_05330 [Pyrenophora teres f. teres]|nr:hypothetical protein HRS9139_05330 [Pyrenophora teres f. teres]